MENTKRKISFTVLFIAFLLIQLLAPVTETQAQDSKWFLDKTNLIEKELIDEFINVNENEFPQLDIQPEMVVEVFDETPDSFSDIEDYTSNRFLQLDVGNDEHNSGVLIVISVQDAQAAIEIGDGLGNIIREAERNNIIAFVEENLEEYISSNKDSLLLNRTVSGAINGVIDIFTEYHFGRLEQRQSELDANIRRDTIGKYLEVALPIVGLLIAIYFLVSIVFRRQIEEKRKEKELKKTFQDYERFYDEGRVPFEDEFTITNFKMATQKEINEKNSHYIKSLRNNKLKNLNRYRVENLEIIFFNLKNEPLTYDFDVYEWHIEHNGKKEALLSNPQLTMIELMKEIDEEIDYEQNVRVPELLNIVEAEIEEFVSNEFSKGDFDYHALSGRLKAYASSKMALYEGGSEYDKAKDFDEKQRQQIYKDGYKNYLIHVFVNYDNHIPEDYLKYGTRDDFVDYTDTKISGIQTSVGDIRDQKVLGAILFELIEVFELEKKIEKEKKNNTKPSIGPKRGTGNVEEQKERKEKLQKMQEDSKKEKERRAKILNRKTDY